VDEMCGLIRLALDRTYAEARESGWVAQEGG
jgi:hypothetical protein